MGQSIRCFPFCDGGCALSVQKIYFYFTPAETKVYFFQTRHR